MMVTTARRALLVVFLLKVGFNDVLAEGVLFVVARRVLGGTAWGSDPSRDQSIGEKVIFSPGLYRQWIEVKGF